MKGIVNVEIAIGKGIERVIKSEIGGKAMIHMMKIGINRKGRNEKLKSSILLA